MNLRLITIISILLISCKPKTNEFKTLDFGSFKLTTPGDWKKFHKRGIDAYVGGLTNEKDSIWFYFGSFVAGFQGDNEHYLFAQDTINGKIAGIKIPKADNHGSIEMYINNAEKDNNFVLSSTRENKDVVLKIFKSVVFKSSDTTQNSSLTSENFKEYPLGCGVIIYQTHCTACHFGNKNFGAPALTAELLNTRTNNWLYTFFKNRQNLDKDTAYLARKRMFNYSECIELPQFSKTDIDQLIAYLKGT
jgi:hypothetical protein